MMFDELDTKIMDILAADARTSNREVARNLGISEGAVRKRLKRLEDAGAARVAAIVAPRAMGLDLLAFVRLETQPSATRRVAEAAAKLENVSFVALTTGRYNIVAFVIAESRKILADILHDEMRQWPGVVSIQTVEIIDAVKHRADIVRIRRPERYPAEPQPRTSRVTSRTNTRH